MYNTDLPTRAELPSTGKLLRSTLMAAVIAVALLITVVSINLVGDQLRDVLNPRLQK